MAWDTMPKIQFQRDEEGLIITPENLRERAQLVAHVRETWKANPDYADILEMELWALQLAADTLERALTFVSEAGAAAFPAGEPADWNDAVKWRCAMTACAALKLGK